VKELLLLLPNLARLVLGLAADPKVPGATKLTLAAAAAYLASPVDLLPDFIPFVGYLDDVILVAILLDGLLNHVDRAVLLTHWPGDPGTLEKAAAIARRVAAWVPRRIKARIFGGPRLR
jgi:uncharacterized membrane protein YkvA (DUF1232 family)